jgi:cell division protein FtsQ
MRGSWLVRLTLGCLCGLVVVLVVGGLAFGLLRDHPYFHVTRVRVYGTEHVSQQELMDLAQVHAGVSLWRIDGKRIRARLLTHPWIREVFIHRLVPNELEFTVYERKPSAVFGNHVAYLVDDGGHVLGPLGPKESPDLPRLTMVGDQNWLPGQQLTDPGIIAGLRVLAQSQEHAFVRHVGITRIEVVNAERFILHTHRGQLAVGANLTALDDKMAFFPTIEEILRSRTQGIEAIDLSFANQIVVKTTTRTLQGFGRLQKRGSGSGQTH